MSNVPWGALSRGEQERSSREFERRRTEREEDVVGREENAKGKREPGTLRHSGVYRDS